MADKDWTTYTHGVSVVVQGLEQMKKPVNPDVKPEQLKPDEIKVDRCGDGTYVYRFAKTSHWFHFAVPTPNQLDGVENVNVESAFVKARLNEYAKITGIHVWVGNKVVRQIDALDLRGPSVFYHVPLGKTPLRDNQNKWAGMAVCALVEFIGPSHGMVCFEGAGATFERP